MDHDAAESPLASYRPDPAASDTLRDTLAEPFLATALAPATVFRCIDQGIESATRANLLGESSSSVGNGVIAMLQLVAGDENRTLALRAICYLRLLNVETRSFEAIGAEFGVKRATVQEVYSNIQARHPGMRSRADKSDASREACRQRRIGQRRPRTPWITAHIWKAALPA